MSKTKYIKFPVSENADLFETRLLEFVTAKAKIKYVRTSLHVANGIHTGYELKEVPDREDEMREMLEECKLQLEYLQNKFGETGTGNNVLSRLEKLLDPG